MESINYEDIVQSIENTNAVIKQARTLASSAKDRAREMAGDILTTVGSHSLITGAGLKLANVGLQKVGLNLNEIGQAVKGKFSDLADAVKDKISSGLRNISQRVRAVRQQMNRENGDTQDEMMEEDPEEGFNYIDDDEAFSRWALQENPEATQDQIREAQNVYRNLRDGVTERDQQVRAMDGEDEEEDEEEFVDAPEEPATTATGATTGEVTGATTGEVVGGEVAGETGGEVAGAVAGSLALPGVGEVVLPLVLLGAGLGALLGGSHHHRAVPILNPSSQFGV